MIVPATHKDTKQQCMINTDFIVDYFPESDIVCAYTLDDSRGAYLIEYDVFAMLMGADGVKIEEEDKNDSLVR